MCAREHRPSRFVFSDWPVREYCWARITEWNDKLTDSGRSTASPAAAVAAASPLSVAATASASQRRSSSRSSYKRTCSLCCCKHTSPFYSAGWEKQIQNMFFFLPRRGKSSLWSVTAKCNWSAYQTKIHVPHDVGDPPETVVVFINSVSLVRDIHHSLKRNKTIPSETWAKKDTYLPCL